MTGTAALPYSPSLWNYSLSPGWTEQEVQVFRNAVMKFGVGNWAGIITSGCLPGKTNSQMNLQLQRILGQQSIAEFQGIHMDPETVGKLNSERRDVTRKNGLIVHTGKKLTRNEILQKVEGNRAKHEISEIERDVIELPTPLDPGEIPALLEQKRTRLKQLELQLQEVRQQITERTAYLVGQEQQL
ncbi:hypothetical protein M427DRAFT_136185 [Gonapodya prolifera JEL478]|uniref:Myb-like domain-containing protein n=1 Tax=Gonapodya prolifera (strain JEL478) TaxID=1344416 RepID=A0A139AAQ3_GONPJ|nr:hypothetical protein M427DRAFT_136185 [Gonapodya prolifera JEL478]|eukprot:KXS13886.1 hypothetical protein M427DRAFT_136185 [Gonapodya prolifera JEL478]